MISIMGQGILRFGQVDDIILLDERWLVFGGSVGFLSQTIKAAPAETKASSKSKNECLRLYADIESLLRLDTDVPR
ncbi:MAG: hypothetical protein SGI97_01455 [candidate division Zixibacteria bacterium]|nr:hypothetical protein [candidate division Zixibacteria bacterium]